MAKFFDSTCAVLCLWAVLGLGSHAQVQVPFSVKWTNERLSIQATNAPLTAIVEEVARLTGLKVVGADKLAGPVTIDIAELPVAEALKALLTDVNYFVQQDPDHGAGGLGLVLRVHSMVSGRAPILSTETTIRVPALEDLAAQEADEIQETKEEEADDPDVEQENQENRHAAQQLVENGAFGSKATSAALERFLHNDNDQIRLEAVKALSQRPLDAAIKLLLEALGDDTIEVRMTAINALARAHDAASLQILGTALEKDADPLVRIGTVRIMALRADDAAIPYLQKALKDDDEVVRTAAGQLIGEFQRLARLKKEKHPPVH